MRFPNGYGSIVKLAGKRRKPFAVRVTADYAVDVSAQKATQKYKYIGYYEKRADAIRALAEYNASPYNQDAVRLTLGEIYARWLEQKTDTVSGSTLGHYESSYTVLAPLVKTPMRDLRLIHLQRVFDESGRTLNVLSTARQLASQLFDYAIKNDICAKNYAKFVDLSKARDPERLEHTAFTAEEIDRLWAAEPAEPRLSIVLMLIYSGVRVSELLELNKQDVHLSDRLFDIKKSKTASGIRRVPIHERTAPFFARWLSEGSAPTLITNHLGKPYTYAAYRATDWMQLLKPLGLDAHRVHDTRHTCISLLTMAHVDPMLIRAIVGHKGQSLTEDVYTHFDYNLLVEAINKI